MIVAILCINIGVLAVATTLSQSTVSAGLGLGLFGVLSIIRLRSQELDQEEVAYYFLGARVGTARGHPGRADMAGASVDGSGVNGVVRR